MSDSPPSGRGAAPSAASPGPAAPLLDVSAMPQVLARIAGLALRYPWRVALTILTSLLAAVASLMLPRLIGRSIDQAHHLLALGSANADGARAALLWTAGLVIAATLARGFLTMWSGYLGEY